MVLPCNASVPATSRPVGLKAAKSPPTPSCTEMLSKVPLPPATLPLSEPPALKTKRSLAVRSAPTRFSTLENITPPTSPLSAPLTVQVMRPSSAPVKVSAVLLPTSTSMPWKAATSVALGASPPRLMATAVLRPAKLKVSIAGVAACASSRPPSIAPETAPPAASKKLSSSLPPSRFSMP